MEPDRECFATSTVGARACLHPQLTTSYSVVTPPATYRGTASRRAHGLSLRTASGPEIPEAV